MRIAFLIAVLLLSASPSSARKKKKAAEPQDFSYYVLSLSWAPDFCANSNARSSAECAPGRKLGFVVHGLWPQGDTTRGPQNCGGSPVSQSIVQTMLNYFPTSSLIQHEWTTHGTCTGLRASEYFAMVRKARDSVQIPDQLKSPTQTQTLTPGQIEAAFAAANPSFPKEAFRTSCTAGALQDVRVCFNKDLSPRACSPSAGECNAQAIKVLPVR
ncbi:MAG: ribonuclease [Candidatus Solibacter sp.]|nr:ribonuclease [Candidatus Solibacter sp.]